MNSKLCLVLMPFGLRHSISGSLIDFDALYNELITPVIEELGFEPLRELREDEEFAGRVIHTSAFESLILTEYAVVDLTIANANVYYELGVRHAIRPWSTIILYAEGISQMPFDLAPLRPLVYKLTSKGTPVNQTIRSELLERFKEAQNQTVDSPIFQLVKGFPEIANIKTDVFRDRFRGRMQHSFRLREQVKAARSCGKESLLDLQKQLGGISDSAVVLDLFLSFRAVKGWSEMVDLACKMSPDLAESVFVQEQVALALNRNGDGENAEKVLLELLNKHGARSETYGILGRIYKDRWEAAYNSGDHLLATGLLDKAIDAYIHGFEADWRDAYPGINAVELMELKAPPDPRRMKLLPVVEYAVDRRIAMGKPDYWDYATLLEIGVLTKDIKKSTIYLTKAIALLSAPWEVETTLHNLKLIREARETRNELIPWANDIEKILKKHS